MRPCGAGGRDRWGVRHIRPGITVSYLEGEPNRLWTEGRDLGTQAMSENSGSEQPVRLGPDLGVY